MYATTNEAADANGDLYSTAVVPTLTTAQRLTKPATNNYGGGFSKPAFLILNHLNNLIFMFKLFTLDAKNNLVINIPEVTAMREFKDVLSRRRPMPGDSDGRKKLFNALELIYVKFMAEADSEESVYHAFNDKERHERIIRDYDIPDDFKVDTIIKLAIAKYKEIQEEYIPSIRILNTLHRGLMSSANTIETYNSQIDKLVEHNDIMLNKILMAGGDTEDATMESVLQMNELLQSNVDKMMKISDKLPQALQRIAELRESVKGEKAKARKKRGDKEKFNREDPN